MPHTTGCAAAFSRCSGCTATRRSAACADWRVEWGGTTFVNVTGAALIEIGRRERSAAYHRCLTPASKARQSEENLTRILLYTGKGGVGKTSIAAATAVLCAQRGLRTLVVSTDIAHSLADALDTPVGPTPRQIAHNLWAHEPDVFFNISRYWRTIQGYFSSLFAWGGLDEVMAEEMTVLPGMDELGNLLWIGDHVDEGEYDLIVVDAAPTGETVRLLSLPEASRWWIEKIAPIGRRVQKLGGPVLRRIVGVPLPSDEVYEAGEQLLDRLRYVHDLLADPDRSSVRLVLNLERVSIEEAQRSFTYFHLYGFPTDMIVANRVLPAASGRLLRCVARSPGALPADGRAAVRAGAGAHGARSSTRRWSAPNGWPSSATRSSATATRRSSCIAAGRTRCSARTAATRCRSSCPSRPREEFALVAVGR